MKLCPVTCLLAVNWEAKRQLALAAAWREEKYWIRGDLCEARADELYALKEQAGLYLLDDGQLFLSPHQGLKAIPVVGFSTLLQQHRGFHLPRTRLARRLSRYPVRPIRPAGSYCPERLLPWYTPGNAEASLRRLLGR